MAIFQGPRGLRAALLVGAGGLTAFVFAGAALAQAADAPAQVTAEAPAADEAAAPASQEIVVTGSRIARQDYQSNSPIVTVDEALFKQSSTAALESNLNKLPQFAPTDKTPTAGADIQPTATNTPGAATVSLRGIGANRTLVLVDGRRATPSNASMTVDISTIPAAAIERVEVISGGASATYGADAVAGVTNFILKKNFKGLQLDAQTNITQRGDNFEFQLGGIMGADVGDGRGNVSLAMSINKRNGDYQRDRKWYRDLWANKNIAGTAFFNPAPGYITDPFNSPNPAVLASIFPSANPAVSTLNPFTVGNIYLNPNGTVFGGTTFAARGLSSSFARPEAGWKTDATGTLGYNNTNLYNIFPLTRYNGIARGNYEINDWIGMFGQALFSSVSTYTRNEPGPITSGWDVYIPHGSAIYTGNSALGIASSLNADGTTNAAYLAGGQYGLTGCPTTGGCAASIVFPTSPQLSQILDSRPNPNAPFQLTSYLPDDRETFTDVLTFNLIAGFEGKIPGTDWTWEAFANRGESTTTSRQTGIYSLERLRAVMGSPNYGRGFSYKGNQSDIANPGFGASTGTCTSGLNFYSPPTGGYSDDCLEAVRADLKNKSKMRQTIAEFDAQGTLFTLPWAGEVKGAIGASYRQNRYDFINDTLTTQGRSFLDQALGIYPSGDVVNARISAKEVYAELLVPVLKDLPFVQNLGLELGGRMSDYNTTGKSYTYKILGDWEVNDWLRFRGGFNRAERAPNIGELFLAAQQTFGIDNRGDQCSRLNPGPFSANPAANPTGAAKVEAICRVLMAQSGNPAAADTYYNGVQSTASFGFAFPTLVGNPNLKPEKANTWTAGVVVRSPFESPWLNRLRFTVDFYDIQIKDAIGAQTIGAVDQLCFDPAFNPLVNSDPTAAANSFYCQLLPRNGTGQPGNTKITYTNSGRVHLKGIDTQVDWSFNAGPGSVFLNSLFSYQIDFKSSPLIGLPMVDYAGTVGPGENGLNSGAFRYRVLTTLGYRVGPASLAIQWQHLPKLEDAAEVTVPGGTPTSTPYPAYDMFNLQGSFAISRDINLRFGVDNLLDRGPKLGAVNPTADPTTGQLSGGAFNATYYDTDGRRFYLGATVKF